MTVRPFAYCAALVLSLVRVAPTAAQDTVDVGKTGFDAKRPVLASACPHGCPWGELGDFVKDAMQPFGYEVILCRNCNRDQGPPIVANASHPPELGVQDTIVGTTTRVDAPVDFGITESGFLAWAYQGSPLYSGGGPFPNLRLIAKIEDPTYLLVAVKADSGITDLKQVADKHMAVKILGGGSPGSQPVLDYYGLTQDAVRSWGGSFTNPIIASVVGGAALDCDIIVSELGSPANNPESAFWTILSQKYDLRFLDLPDTLLDQMANDKDLGMKRVVAKWGLLRGVDRAIPTVARSGHAIFARDDMPDAAAYDTAKAIDEHRDALAWYIRPYSYNSRTVWENQGVPLHPGAERYYREVGYMPAAASSSTKTHACADGGTAAPTGHPPVKGSGCGVVAGNAGTAASVFLATWLVLLARIRRYS
jgi:TRAP transporter TAXI family solute receptor